MKKKICIVFKNRTYKYRLISYQINKNPNFCLAYIRILESFLLLECNNQVVVQDLCVEVHI